MIEDVSSPTPKGYSEMLDECIRQSKDENILKIFCYSSSCTLSKYSHGNQNICPFFWNECGMGNETFSNKLRTYLAANENLLAMGSDLNIFQHARKDDDASMISALEDLFTKNIFLERIDKAIYHAFDSDYYVDTNGLKSFLADKKIDCVYSLEHLHQDGRLPKFIGDRPASAYVQSYEVYTEAKGVEYFLPIIQGSSLKEKHQEICASFLEATQDYSFFAAYNKAAQIKMLTYLIFLFPEYSARLQYIMDHTLFLSDVIEKRLFYHREFRLQTRWGFIGHIFMAGTKYLKDNTFFADLPHRPRFHSISETAQYMALYKYLKHLAEKNNKEE